MNCLACNKPLEPGRQRLCLACQEEMRQGIVKQLGTEEQFKKLYCWPRDGKKDGKGSF